MVTAFIAFAGIPNTWGVRNIPSGLSPDFGNPRNFPGLNIALFIATLYASTARDTCMTKIVAGCKLFLEETHMLIAGEVGDSEDGQNQDA